MRRDYSHKRQKCPRRRVERTTASLRTFRVDVRVLQTITVVQAAVVPRPSWIQPRHSCSTPQAKTNNEFDVIDFTVVQKGKGGRPTQLYFRLPPSGLHVAFSNGELDTARPCDGQRAHESSPHVADGVVEPAVVAI